MRYLLLNCESHATQEADADDPSVQRDWCAFCFVPESLTVHNVCMSLSRSHYAKKHCISWAMKQPPSSMQHVTQGGVQDFGQQRPYMTLSTGESPRNSLQLKSLQEDTILVGGRREEAQRLCLGDWYSGRRQMSISGRCCFTWGNLVELSPNSTLKGNCRIINICLSCL